MSKYFRNSVFAAVYLASLTAFVNAQNAEANKSQPKPDLAREKIVQYVEIKKTISKEKANWETEKKLLNDLVKLRQQEIEKENEILEFAEKRVKHITDKKAALANEMKQRRQWRQDFAEKVASLEQSLIPNLGYLPEPVKNKVSDEIDRLQSYNPKSLDKLQNRFRDISAILNECINFNKEVKAFTVIREIDGERMEVEVLYLGMNQAWYVDRTGKRAGIGIPTASGWAWESKPEIAAQVRNAIDSQSKRSTPAFAKLPIRNGEKQ